MFQCHKTSMFDKMSLFCKRSTKITSNLSDFGKPSIKSIVMSTVELILAEAAEDQLGQYSHVSLADTPHIVSSIHQLGISCPTGRTICKAADKLPRPQNDHQQHSSEKH